MGKGKKNHNKPRDIKAQKRENRKNQALNYIKYHCSEHEIKHQNNNIPELLKQKQNIINDIKKKQKNNSRQELINNLNKKLEDSNPTNYNNLYEMVQDTKSNNNLYDTSNDKNLLSNIEEINNEKKLNSINKEQSKKAYIKILEEVIENSDVLLEVLDSRDPLACRSYDLEKLILSHKNEKKIILVLNKIDLVPTQNAIDWQKYLSREYGTVLFKANTQNQSSNLSESNLFDKNLKENKKYINDVLQSNKSIGGETLLNMLKNYSRTDGNVKRNIVVGVLGFPNVGKSSVINSLTRGKNAGVSSTPGFTKAMQEIILDNNIRLLDCPGVVMSSNQDNILQNVIRTEEIKEPIEVANKIINKISKERIIDTYNLDTSILKGSELTTEKILYLIGNKLNKVKKGGLIDLDKTARLLINDWNAGKIKYFTVPPGIDMEAFKNKYFKNNNNNDKDNMILE